MMCPKCGSPYLSTERRPNGNSTCLICGYKFKTPNKQYRLSSIITELRNIEKQYGNIPVHTTNGEVISVGTVNLRGSRFVHLIDDGPRGED